MRQKKSEREENHTISHYQRCKVRLDAKLGSGFLDTIRLDPSKCQSEHIGEEHARPSYNADYETQLRHQPMI